MSVYKIEIKKQVNFTSANLKEVRVITEGGSVNGRVIVLESEQTLPQVKNQLLTELKEGQFTLKQQLVGG